MESEKIIKINEAEFDSWLDDAWYNQHDGWDRGFWYNPQNQECVTTCETKSTRHNPSGELVCIAWVSGDNNADYDDICFNCSSYLGLNEETGEVDSSSCESWESWRECELKYTDNPSFRNMQFECMCNVGWVKNVKEEAMRELEDYTIEWV